MFLWVLLFFVLGFLCFSWGFSFCFLWLVGVVGFVCVGLFFSMLVCF